MHAALVLFESAQPEATNVSIYCAKESCVLCLQSIWDVRLFTQQSSCFCGLFFLVMMQ